ncbi:MAG TPA: DUF4339 domain-containing protein [Pirellulales bacterium]|jgi:hypothetical protein|nr:DUF4339 domain-containing protein [Pirellulales bacterium]
MAVKKEGELRVRKGESIYGPMGRDDFDRLLASGRFSLADFVSVLGGPWMEILQFVSPPPAGEQGHLRVLRGDRIFSSLNQQRVKRLRAEGRIGDDDLVCTVGGPWMSVADFLSPPRPPEEEPAAETEFEAEPEVEYVPLRWYHVYAEEVDVQEADQWFVRVHGIHSAPLTKRQLRQLLVAQEITPTCLARHITWHQEAWQPIDSIPELAAVLRTSNDAR